MSCMQIQYRRGTFQPRASPTTPITGLCMLHLRSTVLLAILPIQASADAQSVLRPHGEGASRIAEISWVMFIGAGVIFLLVMILLAVALYGKPQARTLLGRRSLIVAGGLALPIAVLSALLAYNLKAA